MISPIWITPTFVTIVNESVLKEGTATDLRFILHAQQNKQHQRQHFDCRLGYCHGPKQMALPGVLLQRSLLLLILVFQLSFLAWLWPSLITTTLAGNGDWGLPLCLPGGGGTCPVSLGILDCPTSQLALVAPWQPDQEPLHVSIPPSEKDMFKFCLYSFFSSCAFHWHLQHFQRLQ